MAGRPTKLTPEVRQKIEEVAALDGTVEEMAYYAGIHRETVYNWMRDDKEFYDRIQELRERPILKARQTIVKSLDTPQFALEYLKRKRKKEFGDSQDITSDGKAITITFGEEFKNYGTDSLAKNSSTESETL